MKVTGAELIVKCLEEQGVEVMFGFPGGVIIDLFDELEKSDITVITSYSIHYTKLYDGRSTMDNRPRESGLD